MIKIGVFGDSFGYEGSIFNEPINKSNISIGYSWVTLLRNNFEIDNFSQPGSDLYFSYYNFINNYKKYNKNIFLITNHNRFSFKFNSNFIHAHSIDTAKFHYINNTGRKREALKASLDYFLYLQDDEKDILLKNLFINDIKNKKSNTIFINCFGYNSLNEIMQIENQAWNLPTKYTLNKKFIDIRKSHLTKENNEILYQKVLKSLIYNSDLEINSESFRIPSIQEKQDYIFIK